MNLDLTNFTPWASLSGGLLLGVATAGLILFHGRILGVSGILGGLIIPRAGDMAWRLAFLLGMAASPLVFFALAPAALATPPRIEAGPGTIVLAGLLVGFGTQLGSGCTSGHGVCGLSRLSPRSLIATLSFMGAGFLTVYLLRHSN